MRILTGGTALSKTYVPNVNTIAYLPLKTDATDQSGNYTVTTDNITFNNGAVFNSSGTSCITFPTTMTNTTFTLNALVKLSITSGYQLLYRQSNNNGNDDSRCYFTGYSSGIQLAIGNTTGGSNVSADTAEHLYTIVVGSSVIKLYIDGTFVYSLSGTVGSQSNAQLSLGNRFYNKNEGIKDGTMREVVIESILWDNDTIQEYYQNIKHLYPNN